MHRARRRGTRLVIPALLLALFAVAGCGKSKPNETPAPAPSASGASINAANPEAGTAPLTGGRPLLCTDGTHRRGDHWKVECNVCRCGADGVILCSEFPCAQRAAPTDASRSD